MATSGHRIYHIVSRADWHRARKAGIHRPESLDTEGFIHCSLRRQVARTANLYYAGQPGLVLLEIDPALVSAEIRHEGEPDQFPHIYGPLETGAVTRILDFRPQQGGQFAFPDDMA